MQREDTPTVYQLLARAAGRIGPIEKSEENREQRFKFRSIEQITGHVRPIFADLGLTIVPKVKHVDHQPVTSKSGTAGWRTTVMVAYRVYGPAGDYVEAAMAGEAIDYGDKATSKAVQMAYKYALTEILLIGSVDADPDSESQGGAAAPTNAIRTPSNRLVPEPSSDDQWVKLAKQEVFLAAGEDADVARDAWRYLVEDVFGYEPGSALTADDCRHTLELIRHSQLSFGKDSVTVTKDEPKEEARPPSEPADLEAFAHRSSLRTLLKDDPTAGTNDQIEKRVRMLYDLMQKARVAGWTVDEDGVDRLHRDLAEWKEGAAHWSDLGVKAEYQAFADAAWREAKSVLGVTATKEGG